jgi:adenine-specific DNA-methyltransferase
MESQYSKLTIDITKKLTKNEKKDYGIYITPNTIITRLYDSVIKNIEEKELNIKNILEPSCGTCEIVNFIDSKMENISIDAIELNDTIYDSIKKLKFKNDVKIIKQNFINYNGNKKTYDLIIGNPPYFVCKKTDVPDEYEEYIYGRPNIFGLFILHSLSFLKNDGILALIIPKSFLNSLYYSKIRNFIKNTCTILKIDNYSDIHDFIDTEQSTFGLIIQKNNGFKENDQCNYSMLLNDNFIFTDDSISLKELFEGSTTLEKIGLKVRTGQIVWNEHKEELSFDLKIST